MIVTEEFVRSRYAIARLGSMGTRLEFSFSCDLVELSCYRKDNELYVIEGRDGQVTLRGKQGMHDANYRTIEHMLRLMKLPREFNLAYPFAHPPETL